MSQYLPGNKLLDPEKILDHTYLWCKSQNFRGYNKHDGLNSPILRSFLGWAKWPRIIAIQGVMRFPCNIRPLLLVPRTINPKGLALLTLGLLDRFKTSGNQEFLAEAEKLLAMLDKCRNRSAEWSGACWGYPYPWQDLGFFAPTNTPNAVVTSFVCEAFLDAYRLTGRREYLETVKSAAVFFLSDLTVIEDKPESLCLAYMPLPMSMKVMDVSILVGAVLAQLAALTSDSAYLNEARRLVTYVVSKQTDYGAWYYTDPPEDSPIGHDNYHTGFILDALWRYMESTNDWRWKPEYAAGLKFYAEKLFNTDGSPRWMSDQDYPHDIHGAAQGLITFSLATKNGYKHKNLTDQIFAWAMKNMYNRQGRFYYQNRLLYTKKFTLLRWCNAWMFRGISSYCLTDK